MYAPGVFGFPHNRAERAGPGGRPPKSCSLSYDISDLVLGVCLVRLSELNAQGSHGAGGQDTQQFVEFAEQEIEALREQLEALRASRQQEAGEGGLLEEKDAEWSRRLEQERAAHRQREAAWIALLNQHTQAIMQSVTTDQESHGCGPEMHPAAADCQSMD